MGAVPKISKFIHSSIMSLDQGLELTSTSGDRDNPQVEIFKSFRVSIEDPCRVVLPVVRPPSPTPFPSLPIPSP